MLLRNTKILPGRAFQDQAQPPDLLGLVRMEVRLIREQIRQQLRHERKILQRRRLDAQISHASLVMRNLSATQGGTASQTPEFAVQVAP